MATKRKKAAPKDAFALLKADHKTVKDLFDQFESSRSDNKKRSIAQEALLELRVHAAVEEEIFYPALKQVLKKQDLLEEAEEEHRVAKTLVEELSAGGGEHFDAKFTVLAENVRHHIKEEEGELFKQAKGRKIDFAALGEQMLARKEELLADEKALRHAEESSRVKPYQELA